LWSGGNRQGVLAVRLRHTTKKKTRGNLSFAVGGAGKMKGARESAE